MILVKQGTLKICRGGDLLQNNAKIDVPQYKRLCGTNYTVN